MSQAPQYTAITEDKFSGKAWRRNAGYTLAAGENLIPLVAAELAQATSALLLGFVQNDAVFQLVAITSLQTGVNLFVAPDGRWLGGYVPAALRGYPFRLVKLPDRADSVLCIDEASGLVVEAGQGEPFYGEGGQPAKAVKEMFDLLVQVERSRTVTQTAVGALAAAGLIQPWPLSIQQGGQNAPVKGLYRLDEAALNALGNDAFLALRQAGALPVAYAQLFSQNQLGLLQQLVQVQAKLKVPAPSGLQNLAGLKGLKGIGLSQDDGTVKFS